MVTRRTAKSKGNSFEYDCQESLKKGFSDIYRTAERGFQRQYDLRSDGGLVVFECKRLKGMSWNQAKKYFIKLESVAPVGYDRYLLFKSNQQPCLVMYRYGGILVEEFETCFEGKFVKHKSTRVRK